MDTKKIITGTITLLAMVLHQPANAAPLPDAAPSNGSIPVQHHQQKPAIPNHIAYLMLMQQLTRAEYRNAHATDIRRIENHLSLDREHAELFLQFILSSYSQMLSTDRAVAARLLCQNNRPRYSGNRAHAVLNAVDNFKASNLREYYRHAHSNLGSRVAGHLDTWLSTIASHSSPGELNRQQNFLHSSVVVEQAMGQVCNVIAAN